MKSFAPQDYEVPSVWFSNRPTNDEILEFKASAITTTPDGALAGAFDTLHLRPTVWIANMPFGVGTNPFARTRFRSG